MDLCGIGLSGLERAGEQVEASARRVAEAGGSGGEDDTLELSGAALGLLAARIQYEANLKVLGTADEMERHTLDTLL